MRVGDVIQVNERQPNWTGCLMIVNDIKDNYIYAGMNVPYKGITYMKLNKDECEYIGRAVLVEAE